MMPLWVNVREEGIWTAKRWKHAGGFRSPAWEDQFWIRAAVEAEQRFLKVQRMTIKKRESRETNDSVKESGFIYLRIKIMQQKNLHFLNIIIKIHSLCISTVFITLESQLRLQTDKVNSVTIFIKQNRFCVLQQPVAVNPYFCKSPVSFCEMQISFLLPFNQLFSAQKKLFQRCLLLIDLASLRVSTKLPEKPFYVFKERDSGDRLDHWLYMGTGQSQCDLTHRKQFRSGFNQIRSIQSQFCWDTDATMLKLDDVISSDCS